MMTHDNAIVCAEEGAGRLELLRMADASDLCPSAQVIEKS
jgi:hypothetical protein